MTQPTQVFPPWLSASTRILTVDGVITTSTSAVELPLTYYGPSIPLGTNGLWTYGGLSSPASSPTPSPTAIPSPSPSLSPSATPPAISASPPSPSPSSPTSVTSSISATASPSSLSSLSSTLPASTTSGISSGATTSASTRASSARPSSSATPTASASSLSQNTKIGITLGVVFGSLFVLALLLCWLLWQRHRVSRIQYRNVPPEATREPGEGSPRASGDEADSLLRASRSRAAGTTTMQDAAPVRLIATPTSRGAGSGTNNRDSDGSSISSYGNLVDTGIGMALSDWPQPPVRRVESTPALRRAGQPQVPTIQEETTSSRRTSMRGHIYPPGLSPTHQEPQQSVSGGFLEPPRDQSLRHVESAPSLPEGYSPLIERPPVNRFLRLPRLQTQGTPERSSFAPSTDEPSQVVTARRAEFSMPRHIKLEDLPQSPGSPADDWPPASSSGRTTFGRVALSRLSQLFWFRNLRPPSGGQPAEASRNSANGSRPTSYSEKDPTDADLEAGRALLGERRPTTQTEGPRPMSTVSGKSVASTVYHDAEEEPVPSTTASVPPLPPLPQAYFGGGNGGGRSQTPPRDPPAYEDEPHQGLSASDLQEVDILDIPAPLPASPFGSTSSKSGRSDGDRLVFPPGLGLPTPRVWDTPSSGSTDDYGIGITVDILEDEPPSAAGHWRNLAQSVRALEQEATGSTFGLPTFTDSQLLGVSEQASIHSMRSHLSPNSARSSGSAPASSRRAFSSSYGSGSSRRGGHSADRSASSMSLSRPSSFSSDARRRRGLGPISPALSAFGVVPSGEGSGGSYLPALRPLSPLGIAGDTVPPYPLGSTLGSGSTTVIEPPSSNTSINAAEVAEERRMTATPGVRLVNPSGSGPREVDITD